jgi:hypothetical protein
MLRARTEPAQEQRDRENPDTATHTRDHIAQTGQRRSEREHDASAVSFRNQSGRNLKGRHGAGVQTTEQADFGVGEPELRLPDRKHDVD